MRTLVSTALGLVVTLLGVTLSTGVLAAEITFAQDKMKDGTPQRELYLEGPIERGDLAKIRSAAEGYFVNWLSLWSPGGDVAEAEAISDYLNDRLIPADAPSGYGTLPPYCEAGWPPQKPKNVSNCVCNSACAIIWLTAPERLGNLVGIHRPRFAYEEFAGLTPREAETRYSRVLEALSQYLRQHDVPPGIVSKMISVPSSENYLLSDAEVDEVGMRRPYLVELLNARCVRFSNSLAFEEQLKAEQKGKENTYNRDPNAANFQALREAQQRLDDFAPANDYRRCTELELFKMKAEKQRIVIDWHALGFN